MDPDRYRIKPNSRVKLSGYDPDETTGISDKDEAEDRLDKLRKRLSEQQQMLYARGEHALLVVLQALDAGGKDGTIRHIFTGINPQGCSVASFKVPTPLELAHDFLWRVHAKVPPLGMIGIFNRSHYESVLVERVHELVPEKTWRKRYAQINAFEELLAESGVVIRKFFLHISKDEQKKRIEERISDPAKNWKMNTDDLKERARWDEYQEAFEDALSKCSTDVAPWYVIPANRKWYRNVVITEALVQALEALHLSFPKGGFDPSTITVK